MSWIAEKTKLISANLSKEFPYEKGWDFTLTNADHNINIKVRQSKDKVTPEHIKRIEEIANVDNPTRRSFMSEVQPYVPQIELER